MFCPSHLPDGGPLKPQLALWQYCRAFVVRGSFVERELAPRPSKIAPPTKEVRKAMVDC